MESWYFRPIKFLNISDLKKNTKPPSKYRFPPLHPTNRKHYRKHYKKHIGIIIVIFGPFMVNMCLDNTFKSFLELICFRLVQSNPGFIILKSWNSKFHDLWIFEPVAKPQNQHYLSLETPRHVNKIKKKPWNDFDKY